MTVGSQDIEADKPSNLGSDEQVLLHIVVFKKDDDLSSQYIAGFGTVVEIPPRTGISQTSVSKVTLSVQI